MVRKILLIEDDPVQVQAFEISCKKRNYKVVVCSHSEYLFSFLSKEDAADVDLVVFALSLNQNVGRDCLRVLKRCELKCPKIFLTEQDGIRAVLSFIHDANNDKRDEVFLKPVDYLELNKLILKCFKRSDLKGSSDKNSSNKKQKITFSNIIGHSAAMQKSVKLALKAAKIDIPILLEGESGVGKEVFANAIWQASNRNHMPFIIVNCGAIPENLVESILFGHEKGAFTGADEKHIGKFEEADGGTIFLDEIGELPFDLQVKLLRVLQEGEVDPVGSQAPVKVNVRLISATNKNLKSLVEEKSFREDLFYRLNVFPIGLSPLREREEDIELLARNFIQKFCISQNIVLKEFSDAALKFIRHYEWPGNVRQLKNIIQRAVILSDGEKIEPKDFGLGSVDHSQRHSGFENGFVGSDLGLYSSNEYLFNALDSYGHIKEMAELELNLVRFAVKRYNGQMSEVARRLNIGRSTLYRRLGELEKSLALGN